MIFSGQQNSAGTAIMKKIHSGSGLKALSLNGKKAPMQKKESGARIAICQRQAYQNALMGKPYDDARLHLFHGAHDPGKVRGTIELRIQPDITRS